MSGQVHLDAKNQRLQYGAILRATRHAAIVLAIISSLALFIIGCVGAAGAFPGSSIGWIAVGLGGGVFALKLAFASKTFSKRKFQLIAFGLEAAVLVTIGSLGVAGILSATQVGWGITGTWVASIPIIFMSKKCATLQNEARIAMGL